MSDKKRKWLYSFEVQDGEKKRNFAIQFPNWRVRESCDLFYSGTVSKYIKSGILPRAALKTTLDNAGGTISNSDKTDYEESLKAVYDNSIELGRKQIKPEEERTADDFAEITALETLIKELQKKIYDFEAAQLSMYENTAEAKARNKTITWLLLHLSYEKIGEEYQPIFKGKTLDDKLDEYEGIEDDEFLIKNLSRINYLITLWFLGRAETEEDFAKYDKGNLEEENGETTDLAPIVDIIIPEKLF